MLRSFMTILNVSGIVLLSATLCTSSVQGQVRPAAQDGRGQSSGGAASSGRASLGKNASPAAQPKAGTGQPPVRTVSSQTAQAGQGAAGGQGGQGGQGNPVDIQALLEQRKKQLPPGLYELLEEWHKSSAKIDRLEGEHLRRVYDTVFKVEFMSNGKFYYERPDKGRIDVVPTEITPAMLQARQQGKVPAMKDKETGKIYDLKADKNERWICDGQRVYEIHVDTKEAEVMPLPAGMGGVNIMDSPLPFLFGMPADKAVDRFDLSFTKPLDRASGFAWIKALSRFEVDTHNWKSAEIILDLKNMLPTAVRLVDPAGTKITSYTFNEMKVNEKDWFKLPLMSRQGNLFQPNLDEYKINTIAQNVARVPNVEGMAYQDAVIHLERMGLKKDGENRSIFLDKGEPAKRTEDIYRVQKQTPEPGTQIEPGTQVRLSLYTDPNPPSSQKPVRSTERNK